MQFLKAEWLHLIMANYAVSPELLREYVPFGTEIDTHNEVCYVSLVAFLFQNTKILGLKIPGHINFEEVNLRFYVRPISNPTERSVTFIKEIVPVKTIPLVANSFFKENYVAMNMGHKIEHSSVSYSWGTDSSFKVSYSDKPSIPSSGSVEEFISEHYYGFTKNGIKTIKYYVTHPQWKVAPASDYSVNVNFESEYGKSFSILNSIKPSSVFYAKGSEVSVSFPSRLKNA
jgi:uncharacterized protein